MLSKAEILNSLNSKQ